MSYELKPQLKVLGPKYGAKLGAIRNYLGTCDASLVVDKVNAGGTVVFDADGTEIELCKDDLLISPISKEGFVSESDGKVTVVLDTELSEELLELGLVREFISRVQQTRKDIGLEVTDHINIFVNASETTNAVLKKYESEIIGGTLANSLSVGENDGETYELNGENVKLKLVKA